MTWTKLSNVTANLLQQISTGKPLKINEKRWGDQMGDFDLDGRTGTTRSTGPGRASRPQIPARRRSDRSE
jgi:hypothetical protein